MRFERMIPVEEKIEEQLPIVETAPIEVEPVPVEAVEEVAAQAPIVDTVPVDVVDDSVSVDEAEPIGVSGLPEQPVEVLEAVADVPVEDVVEEVFEGGSVPDAIIEDDLLEEEEAEVVAEPELAPVEEHSEPEVLAEEVAEQSLAVSEQSLEDVDVLPSSVAAKYAIPGIDDVETVPEAPTVGTSGADSAVNALGEQGVDVVDEVDTASISGEFTDVEEESLDGVVGAEVDVSLDEGATIEDVPKEAVDDDLAGKKDAWIRLVDGVIVPTLQTCMDEIKDFIINELAEELYKLGGLDK